MKQMESVGAMPRILAEDLFIFKSGKKHLEKLECAFDLTHEHIEDMGANIAPSKSITHSLCFMFYVLCVLFFY